MSVESSVLAELQKLGEEAVQSSDGQRALNLASVLDDRAGIQAGGVASTDKRLGELLTEIRERYQPKGTSRLELIRGTGASA